MRRDLDAISRLNSGKRSPSLLADLVSIYRTLGFEPSFGLNPLREGSGNAPFCYFYDKRRDNFMNTGGGLALDELWLIEQISSVLSPATIYTIGVAMGWSTTAFCLLNPHASVIGIDNCVEGTDAERAVMVAMKAASLFDLRFKLFIGSSPEDVPASLAGSPSVDMALIDGLHTNSQIVKDFEALLPYISESSVILFHDVLNFNMMDGFHDICSTAAAEGFESRILRRTSSGMGVLYRNVTEPVIDVIESFHQHFELKCPT